MSKKTISIAVLAGFVIAMTAGAGLADEVTIAEYPFPGSDPASTDSEPNSTAADFVVNPTVDWGFSNSAGNVFARSNATTDSEAAAVAADDYFSFTVTPNAGNEFDLTELTFDTIHDLTLGGGIGDPGATMSFFVRSSLDSFAANIGSIYTQAWNTTTPRTLDLSGAAYQGIGTATEFRMYVHDSGIDLAQNGGRLDNISLLGTVVTTGVTITSFREGASPTAAYAHDAVMIRSNQAGSNQNAAGSIIIGLAETGNERLRGLFEFDVTAIPASDKIDEVSLNLTTLSSPVGINNVGAPGDFTTFNVYTHEFDIDETTATWDAPGGGAPAGGTLGDLLTSASFDVEITDQSVTFDDTAEFRAAVADALAGDGILRLILANADETNLGSHDFARFFDDTAAATNDRPELLVTHSLAEMLWQAGVTADWTSANWTSDGGTSFVAPVADLAMIVNSGKAIVSTDVSATPATSLNIARDAAGGTVEIDSGAKLAVTGGDPVTADIIVGDGGTLNVNGLLVTGGVNVVNVEVGGTLTLGGGSMLRSTTAESTSNVEVTVSGKLGIDGDGKSYLGDTGELGGDGDNNATNLTLGDAAVIDWIFGGVGADNDSYLTVKGLTTLGAALTVNIIDGGGSADGDDVYLIRSLGGVVNRTETTLGDNPAGWTGTLEWIQRGASLWDLQLTGLTTSGQNPGDTNADGFVNAADTDNFESVFGLAGAELTDFIDALPPAEQFDPDFDDDGDADLDDFVTLRESFGNNYNLSPSAGANLATTPEPCSAVLMLLGLGAVIRRRKKCQGR